MCPDTTGTSQTTTRCTSPPPLSNNSFGGYVTTTSTLPEKWLEAKIILLFQKGDVTNPVNYRPIALLNSVYKIIATHANRELLTVAIEHSIIHPTQFGGPPNRRCQDHIFNLLSTFVESVRSYSLHIDFNKAFNFVSHTTLFTVLSRLKFPTPLVNLIPSLYRARLLGTNPIV